MADGARAPRVIEDYLARHAAADTAGVVALFAEEARLEDPVGSPPCAGTAAIDAFYRATHARNGRLVFERIGPPLVGGDETALHVRARLERLAPETAMDVIYTFRIDGSGRIAALRAYF